MDGSAVASTNRAAWKRATGATVQRRIKAVPSQEAAPAETLDYGAQRFQEAQGALERAVDGSPIRIQYADPRNPGVKRAKVMVQNVVDGYFAKRKITWREWKGADNLRAAWFRAGGEGVRAADLQRTRVDGTAALLAADPEALMEYRERMRDLGRELARCIWFVVIANYSAREYAHKVGLGRDDGWGVLKIGLRVLAAAYGIPEEGLPEGRRQARQNSIAVASALPPSR